MHPIQGGEGKGVVILLVASCYGNRVRSGCMGHYWVRVQTLPTQCPKMVAIKNKKNKTKKTKYSPLIFLDSLVAEINPLNQRRGSEMILREALRRDSSRDSISGIKPLQPQKSGNPHAITSRSLSLQAAPVTGERGPFAKRSRSTKKREGKTQSLICFTAEGKYLKDLMWLRTFQGALFTAL